MADDAGVKSAKSSKHEKSRGARVYIWFGAAQECFSDWMTDLGLVINIVAVFALIVGISALPLSSIVSSIIGFYTGVRNNFFYPFEELFGFQISATWKDFLIAWTTFGVIGARTTIWLNKMMYAALHAARLNGETVAGRKAGLAALGQAKFDEELQWIKRREEFHHMTPYKMRVMYLGCLVTGPLFFLRIWQVRPPTPEKALDGRHMLIVQLATLAAGFLALFAFNWVTP